MRGRFNEKIGKIIQSAFQRMRVRNIDNVGGFVGVANLLFGLYGVARYPVNGDY